MNRSALRLPPAHLDFAAACDLLEAALAGPVRAEILDRLARGGDRSAALRRLRSAMRTHVFPTAGEPLELDLVVDRFDARTRREGIHVLLEWHEVAYRFIEDDIPVVLLDAAGALDGARSEREGLALLLDFYFLYVLALCAMRAWDDGDPGANLDRVAALLDHLNGPRGSGVALVEEVGTLLFLAVSTFEPDELAYPRLLARVRTLDEEHRLGVARAGGPLLGCHLRWGFPALYELDLGRMRADNFIDYPWLFFSVAELARCWTRLRERGAAEAGRLAVAGALLNALTPDPAALLGEAPASLAADAAEHAEVRALLLRHRATLLADFDAHRPEPGRYSPLGFHFNFPHNVVFAAALQALLEGRPPEASLDALLDGRHPAAASLAERLTRFAAAHPEPRGDRWVLGLYHDPGAASRAFAETLAAFARGGALSSDWG